MSREKCEGVGLAQDAHKYVKVPRGKAQSRPTHIYRGTPSNRAVIPKRGVTRRVCHAYNRRGIQVCRSNARHVSCTVKFPMVVFVPSDASDATEDTRPSFTRRGPVRVTNRRAPIRRVRRWCTSRTERLSSLRLQS
jgi:hypothetical protein